VKFTLLSSINFPCFLKSAVTYFCHMSSDSSEVTYAAETADIQPDSSEVTYAAEDEAGMDTDNSSSSDEPVRRAANNEVRA